MSNFKRESESEGEKGDTEGEMNTKMQLSEFENKKRTEKGRGGEMAYSGIAMCIVLIGHG